MAKKETKKVKNKPKVYVEKPEKQPNHEINGIIIIAIGFLLSLGIYSDGSAILLKLVNNFLGGLFGGVIYAIPPVIIIYGILVMFQKADFTMEKRAILLVLLFILIAGIFHIKDYGDFDNLPQKYDVYEQKVVGIDTNAVSKEFFDLGTMKKGGGLFGGFVALVLAKLVGVYGAIVILATGILVLILMLTKISFVSFVLFVKQISVWTAKLTYDSIKFFKRNAKTKNIEKKLAEFDVEAHQKQYDVIKNNIDNEVAAIKNVVPEKVSGWQKENYEQQDLSSIKSNIKEEEKPKIKSNEVETVHIDTKPDLKMFASYKFPHINFLNKAVESDKPKNAKKEVMDNAKKLESTLASFGVDAKVVEINRGPSVTRYELHPSVGVKVSKIVNLSDDIALNLASSGIRIEAPIPGKAAVGIEVPNKEISSVFVREIIENDKFKNHPSKVAFALGKDVGGDTIVADIAKMPHLLIAGATGSGKSVCINTLIASILYKASPEHVKLLMIDPKVVELGVYNGIPHLLIPVVTEPKKAAGALNWAVGEMVNRYKTFAQYGVRDIKGFNTLVNADEALPEIVIIIDELADLMMVAPNDVEDAICRLAQMARAAGMHLIIATQRPSVDVITGVIKANIPSRISFAVSSQVDSRTILDMAGAEKLLGRGDMLFYPVGEPKPIRVQGAFISDKEVEKIVEYIKTQKEAEYDENIMEKINAEKDSQFDPGDNDELLPQAIEIIIESGQASVSMLQRRLKVGYARAARMIDQMEARGIVGGFEGSKPRQVLISKQEFYSEGFQI